MENSNSKKTISISEIITLMGSGYTRTNTARNYNPEIGCIQDYYDLPKEQVKLLFEHPKLAGVKTTKVIAPTFTLVDDTAENVDDVVTTEPMFNETPSVISGVTINENVEETITSNNTIEAWQ
jgi:hypothetical protein